MKKSEKIILQMLNGLMEYGNIFTGYQLAHYDNIVLPTGNDRHGMAHSKVG